MAKPIPPPPKAELERLYIGEKKSSRELAKRYKCCNITILKWLHKYNIRVRTVGNGILQNPTEQQLRTRNKQLPVCDTLKKHAKDLKDDPERLSTEFMQKMIGVNC